MGSEYLVATGQRNVDECFGLQELMKHGRHVEFKVIPAQTKCGR